VLSLGENRRGHGHPADAGRVGVGTGPVTRGSRADRQGVLFILNCSTLAEAKAIMSELPLAKANLANFEYTALGPLTPLRRLLAEPSASMRNSPQ
jgi:hypothetical protein